MDATEIVVCAHCILLYETDPFLEWNEALFGSWAAIDRNKGKYKPHFVSTADSKILMREKKKETTKRRKRVLRLLPLTLYEVLLGNSSKGTLD